MPGTVMKQWLIRVVVCLAVCGCQAGGRQTLDDCASPSACDEDDQGWLLAPGNRSGLAANMVASPGWLPGCPASLQVMAQPHPIVYRAYRPDEEPDTTSDPADWVCEAPEAPLLRADRQQDFARR